MNRKGSILPVTIVAMLIMTIVGLISLRMFMAQNILNTYDQVKVRLQYSAESMIELIRGHIDYETNIHKANNVSKTGDLGWIISGSNYLEYGYLYCKVFESPSKKWRPMDPGGEAEIVGAKDFFDFTMFPGIKVSGYCERDNTSSASANGITPYNIAPSNVSYKIVAIASTTFDYRLLVTTLTYHFHTVRTGNKTEAQPYNFEKHFDGWRKS